MQIIADALLGGASALMAIGLTVVIAWVAIGVTEYFLLEKRLDAEAKRQSDDFTDDGELIDLHFENGMSLDELICQYDREQD